MKKSACFCFLCFLLLPVAASCCNLAGMLSSSVHADWKNPACLDKMAQYVKTHRLTDRQRAVIAKASNHSVSQAQELLRAGRVDQARALAKKWQGIRTGTPRYLVRMDERGNILPPEQKSKTRPSRGQSPDLAAALAEEHERQRPENQLVLPGLSYSDAEELFCGGKQTLQEMRLPLERLDAAVRSGANLDDFIRMVAEKGSADSSDPKYLSTQFIQASFMYYAESLAPALSGKLTAYMNKKYAWRVRYAAALAAAAYSEKTLGTDGVYRVNEPSGKFFLNDDERAAIRGLFAYAVMKNPDSEAVLQYRLARVYDWGEEALFYAQADGPEDGSLLIAGAPAAVVALSASEASALSISVPAVVVVGGLWILGSELNDAFSSTYQRNFTHALEGALPVGPAADLPEEYGPECGADVAQCRSKPLIETASVVRGQVGALTDAATSEQTAQTCIYDPATRAKPEKWKLKDLGIRLNDPDGSNSARFYDCLAEARFCPKSKRPHFSFCRADRLDTHIRKSLSPLCQAEFDQIDKVMKDIHHFYDPSNKRVLKVRAAWWGGRWKTEAELPLRVSGPIDWVRMFGAEFENLVWWIPGASRGLRFGNHEMDTVTEWNNKRYHHFHYMELLPYKGGQQFICNHMLFATYDEMSKYFGF